MTEAMKWKPRFDLCMSTMGSVIVGNDEALRLTLIALLAKRHIILTSKRGRGKTMLAKAFQQIIKGGTTARLQGAPDALASELIGRRQFDEVKREYIDYLTKAMKSNIVLIDEINRYIEATLTAILQPLEEGIVTIGENDYDLPELNLFIAAQNPVGQKGTFGLTEAARDRWIIETDMKYPDKPEMIRLLGMTDVHESKATSVEPVFEIDEILAMQKYLVGMVKRSPANVKNYIDDLLRITQVDLPSFGKLRFDTKNPYFTDSDKRRLKDIMDQPLEDLEVLEDGVSPRGDIWFLHVACGNALVEGRDEVTIADVEETLLPANRHRLVMTKMAKVLKVTPDDVLKAARWAIKY